MITALIVLCIKLKFKSERAIARLKAHQVIQVLESRSGWFEFA